MNCQLAQPDPVLLLEHQKNALRVTAFAQLRAEIAENAAGEARRFIQIVENQNFKRLKNLHFLSISPTSNGDVLQDFKLISSNYGLWEMDLIYI